MGRQEEGEGKGIGKGEGSEREACNAEGGGRKYIITLCRSTRKEAERT